MHLLTDAGVHRWYNNVARGSKVTADVYLRRLGNFCEARKLTPKQLISMDEREIKDLLLDFVTELEKRKKAGGYIKSILKAINSWLDHNDRKPKLKIKIKGINETPR